MKKLKEEQNIIEYCAAVEDLLRHEKVKEMKNYPHHGKIDTHFHSVYVSFHVFKISKALGLDFRSITRAALLHDFYLYDWHTTKHEEMHAWYHPKEAVKNAEKYFGELSDMQKEMILHHMWPLAKTPRTIGGAILTMCDKHCANMDLAGLSKSFLPIYNEITKRSEKND